MRSTKTNAGTKEGITLSVNDGHLERRGDSTQIIKIDRIDKDIKRIQSKCACKIFFASFLFFSFSFEYISFYKLSLCVCVF